MFHDFNDTFWRFFGRVLTENWETLWEFFRFAGDFQDSFDNRGNFGILLRNFELFEDYQDAG